MEDYIPTIGLEIHAELRTETKMFCCSKNDTEEKKPNVNICPVCMGYPGSLPTLNKQAIRHVLTLGAAVGGQFADYTEFDRKNYFYPDIPKGYQISQYKHPLVTGGELSGVALTRIHLEEDTAKSSHSEDAPDVDYSLLDFNRAGVPLLELVTEPVIHDAETASQFAKELQLLLVYLGASHANMERGEMRVEANISVAKKGEEKLGTKVEIKNLNSFKAVEKSIRYEIERHIAVLEKGESVVQETRGWDENKEETFSQRVKEDSHDYRYFPDPDLPKLFISEIPEFSKEAIEADLPELPGAKRERYKREYGLKDQDIEIFVRDLEWGRFFEDAVSILGDSKLAVLASNYISSDLKTLIPTDAFGEVMKMIDEGLVSSRGAKDLLKVIQERVEDGTWTSDVQVRDTAQDLGLIQKSDTAELEKVAQKIISENTTAVEEYKKGKEASLQFLIGQAMKETKGSANPKILKEVFERILL